ncbi:hypothetical protein LNP25_29925 [Klebsiella variicola subsp. variicola]|nr:hypothetical protein [Klebsiella variicola subsp. variicola]
MRRDLMADISHELRTPLAVLRGELEAIQDGVRRFTPSPSLPAGRGGYPHQAGGRPPSAVDVRRGGAGLPENVAGYHHPAGGGRGRFRERFASRQLSIQVSLPEQAMIFGDRDRLMQLFNNLLENQPALYRQRRQPAYTARRSGRMLVIDFADSAPGVSDEQLARLCERFYRAEGSRNRASGGSGLGLAICLNIVAAHGGTLRADHSPLAGLALKLSYLWNMIYRETYD